MFESMVLISLAFNILFVVHLLIAVFLSLSFNTGCCCSIAVPIKK